MAAKKGYAVLCLCCIVFSPYLDLPHVVLPCVVLNIRSVVLCCVALRCVAFHCVALLSVALHCVALLCIKLRCTALHYITLHCMRCVVLCCLVLDLSCLHFFMFYLILSYSRLWKNTSLSCMVTLRWTWSRMALWKEGRARTITSWSCSDFTRYEILQHITDYII